MLKIGLLMTSFFFSLQIFASLSEVDLQTRTKDLAFIKRMQTVDLNLPEYSFEYKTTGTSLGLKIAQNGKKIAKWVPNNEATNVEAQVVAYHLARYFWMSDLVSRSAYYTLAGPALETFKNFLQTSTETNRLRILNRNSLLSRLTLNPHFLLGVITDPAKHSVVKGLEDVQSNTISPDHPIAKFILAENPQPSGHTLMSLDGVLTKDAQVPTETELALAKQFSQIMVLDMLCGQWDRFSGKNLEASWDETSKRVRFYARDNGGAHLVGINNINKYFKIVTRFDRQQILRLKILKEELVANPESVRHLLRIQRPTHSLLERAELILDHIKKQEDRFGEQAYFQ